MRVFTSFILGLIGIIGCGGPSKPKAVPQISSNTVTVALFGAPWCSNCKTSFPQIQQEINALTPDKQSRVTLFLYVPTGRQATDDKPTDAGAEEYRQALGLNGKSKADPKWKVFRRLVGDEQALPAAAILNEQGEVIKKYRGGDGFVSKDIVSFAASVLP